MVARKLGIPQISTGAILREAMKAGTPVGLDAKSYVDSGLLVPDDVMIALVRERLTEPDCTRGFILDGFPRTLEQAKILDGFCKLDLVIDLVISDEAIVHRLTGRRVCADCGATYHIDRLTSDTCLKCSGALIIRQDDAPETVLNRLEVYHRQTAPLETYYTQMDLLREVDGALSLEDGFTAIDSILRTAGE